MAIPTSALDLRHRLFCRFFWRELLLNHYTFDVFHHHDGVIDQQAYRQHHAKHRQGVDGVAKHRQYRKGTQQHDRNGNRRNERCAHVLQKQIHDKKDEDNCLKERFNHFVDGYFDERGRIVRIDNLHPLREVGL